MQTSMPNRLDQLVIETSDHDAVYFDDGNLETRMTYHQIRSFVDTLVSKLRSLTKRDAPIGVIMENSVLVPAIVLGILRSGSYFHYMYPNESGYDVKDLCSKHRISVIISDSLEIQTLVPDLEVCCTIQFDPYELFILARPSKIPVVSSVSILDNPAYLVRTSGSTGIPKFVLVPHEAIIPNIIDFKNLFQVSSRDVIALGSPMIFDPSIIDIFVALSSGAQLLVIPERLKQKPNVVRRLFFDKYKISVLLTTPSFIRIFDHQTLKSIFNGETSLRCLTLQGEPFPVDFILKHLSSDCHIGIDLFNSYGVTEISSLATCCRVTPGMIKNGLVPLGDQLSKTKISIQFLEDTSDFSLPLESGRFGFILIGGKDRKCLINYEHWSTFPDPWFTGDIVRVDEKTNEIFYVGRSDYQIKRRGKRINLEEISSAAMKSEGLKACVCIFDKNTERIVCALEFNDLAIATNNDIRYILNDVKRMINDSMPNYSRPDGYVVFDAFPLTISGKIDRLAVEKEIFRKEKNAFKRASDEGIRSDGETFSNLDKTLECIVREILNLPDEVVISPRTFLWNLGCDSLKSLHLITSLNEHFGRDFTECFDCVIFETFETLIGKINDLLRDRRVHSGNHEDYLSNAIQSTSKPKIQRIKLCENINIFRKASFIECKYDTRPSNLLINFSYDMGKCIDASPLIVESEPGSRLYIGSHSHRFVCLDPLSGSCIWSIELPDRIESSANISPCGLYIIVGCYDGVLYFLNKANGDVHWSYKTGDVIKCTASCSALYPFTYFGSYDGFLYAVNYQTKSFMFKVNLDSPILSSPILIKNDAFVVVATLKGTIASFSAENGQILWRYEIRRPIFADLIFVERNEQLIIFGVNGSMHCLKAESGIVLQEIELPETPHVFKTPVLLPSGNFYSLLITTQNGHLYLYNYNGNCSKWSLGWFKALADSPLTSPFVLTNSSTDAMVFILTASDHSLIVHFDSNGNSTELNDIDLRTISQRSSDNKQLQNMGEIFSSPVIYDHCVYFGSRNNLLYSIKLR